MMKGMIFYFFSLLLCFSTTYADEKRPDLKTLIDAALSNLPHLKAAELRIEAANVLLEEVSSLSLPRIKINAAAGPMPERTGDVLHSDTNQDDFFVDRYGILGSLKAGFTVPIYTFGKIDLLKKESVSYKNLAIILKDLTRQKLTILITSLYYRLSELYSLIDVIDEADEKIKDAIKKMKKRLKKVGIEDVEKDPEVLRLLSHRDELLFYKENIRGQIDGIRVSLEDMTSIKLKASWRPQKLFFEPEQIESCKNKDHPEVKILELKYRIQKQKSILERLKLLPDFAIIGGMSVARCTVCDDQKNPFVYDPYNFFNAILGVAMRFDLNPFVVWKREKRLNLMGEAFRYDTEAKTREIDIRRKTLLTQYNALLNAMKLLKRSIKSAKDWFIEENMNFTIGVGDSRDLVEAFKRYYELRARLGMMRIETIRAKSQLDYLLSGCTQRP